MSEKTITAEEVRQEHLETVNVPAHWAYLLSVLVGSTLVMLLFLALLGAGGS